MSWSNTASLAARRTPERTMAAVDRFLESRRIDDTETDRMLADYVANLNRTRPSTQAAA